MNKKYTFVVLYHGDLWHLWIGIVSIVHPEKQNESDIELNKKLHYLGAIQYSYKIINKKLWNAGLKY